MRRNLIAIALAAIAGCQPAERPLPRIAIAGLGIESSTFSPALTDEAAFHARYGDTVFATYPFMAADSPLRSRALSTPRITRAISYGIGPGGTRGTTFSNSAAV